MIYFADHLFLSLRLYHGSFVKKNTCNIKFTHHHHLEVYNSVALSVFSFHSWQ